jgi:hypothetical protein
VQYSQLSLLVNIKVLSYIQLPEDHGRMSHTCATEIVSAKSLMFRAQKMSVFKDRKGKEKLLWSLPAKGSSD